MFITLRRISSISAGARGSGVRLLSTGGEESLGGRGAGGGENGCIMSESESDDDGAGIRTQGCVVVAGSWLMQARVWPSLGT